VNPSVDAETMATLSFNPLILVAGFWFFPSNLREQYIKEVERTFKMTWPSKKELTTGSTIRRKDGFVT
jgi:hypothetical protein